MKDKYDLINDLLDLDKEQRKLRRIMMRCKPGIDNDIILNYQRRIFEINEKIRKLKRKINNYDKRENFAVIDGGKSE